MHEMNLQQTEIVKDCVYQAIRNSQDREVHSAAAQRGAWRMALRGFFNSCLEGCLACHF